MASIHRRPDSQYWHAAYFGPDGHRILRSTKQSNHQAALAVAMEFERASKLARRGELVEAQAREVLKDIMKRADIGETIQSATIKAHFEAGWPARSGRRKPPGNATEWPWMLFLMSLGKRASQPLTSLTAADVERFLNYRTAKNLSPATLNLDVKIIGGALNVARRQGLIPTNPAEAVELPEAWAWNAGHSPRRK